MNILFDQDQLLRLVTNLYLLLCIEKHLASGLTSGGVKG